MSLKTNAVTCLVLLIISMQNCLAEEPKKGKSPLDELPPYIKQLTWFGERADFSHDGKKILFLGKTFGDAYEVEISTGRIHTLTNNYYHHGYTRALYLANGDILLSGPRRFDPNDSAAGRSEDNAQLWFLNKDLSGPPTPLGEFCSEGPAVSRKRMHIAWTRKDCFYAGDIVYENGRPKITNKKKILDAKELPFKCNLETQNFRPPDEKELTFAAYNYQGTEVCGLDIESGRVVNYSKAPDQFNEPEGIFPDGKYTTMECDRHNPKGPQYDDIYKLALDGSGSSERMTFFSDYPGYKASNPVISDDGKFMAFQVARTDDWAGVGRGILLFDLTAYEKSRNKEGEKQVTK